MDAETQQALERAEALISAAMEILVSCVGYDVSSALGQQLVEDYARHHSDPDDVPECDRPAATRH